MYSKCSPRNAGGWWVISGEMFVIHVQEGYSRNRDVAARSFQPESCDSGVYVAVYCFDLSLWCDICNLLQKER